MNHKKPELISSKSLILETVSARYNQRKSLLIPKVRSQRELLLSEEKQITFEEESDVQNSIQRENEAKKYPSVFYYNPQCPKYSQNEKNEMNSILNYPPSPTFGEISFGENILK